MANMPWFRFYSEALDDRKIARAVRLSGQPKACVLGVWLTLLCLANESPERGRLMISDDIWMDEDEILAETGLDPVAFGKIASAFQQLGMLNIGAGYELPNWDKRQFPSDNSTERVRRHRAKKRKAKQDETLPKRSSNVIEENREDKEEEGPRAPTYYRNIWKRATGVKPGVAREHVIAERLGDEPDTDRLNTAARMWLGRGHSPFNIDGICDWYDNLKRDPGWSPNGRNFNGPTQADLAWADVSGAIHRVGSREIPEFEGVTGKAIRQAGGYKALCQMNERDAERTFKAAYQEAA